VKKNFTRDWLHAKYEKIEDLRWKQNLLNDKHGGVSWSIVSHLSENRFNRKRNIFLYFVLHVKKIIMILYVVSCFISTFSSSIRIREKEIDTHLYRC
jgi:hypothetical protein